MSLPAPFRCAIFDMDGTVLDSMPVWDTLGEDYLRSPGGTGLLPYFSCLLTCSEVGAGKDRPDIYFAALAALSAKREETLVFEDAVHAIETAKAAGFAVAAVRDASMEAQAPRIRALADLYLDALSDFPLR